MVGLVSKLVYRIAMSKVVNGLVYPSVDYLANVLVSLVNLFSMFDCIEERDTVLANVALVVGITNYFTFDYRVKIVSN